MGEVDKKKTDEVSQVLYSEDYRTLACLFGLTKQDGIPAQDIYLFFLDPSQAEDLFQPGAEKTVDEYLKSLPTSISKTIYLIKCPVSEEELHKLSLSRIYPWSLTERLGRLPALVRLDGARRLQGSDLTDFAKLHLLFSKTQPRRTAISPPRSGGEVRPSRGVVLNLSQGVCSLHGRQKPIPARPLSSELYEDLKKTQGTRGRAEKKKKPQTGGGRRGSLPEVTEICAQRQVVEVERRRQPEPPPVTPPPPLVQPQLKTKKKKKKRKKGKGKGKKGKGKGKRKGKKK